MEMAQLTLRVRGKLHTHTHAHAHTLAHIYAHTLLGSKVFYLIKDGHGKPKAEMHHASSMRQWMYMT